jgi:hypothetical protein
MMMVLKFASNATLNVSNVTKTDVSVVSILENKNLHYVLA